MSTSVNSMLGSVHSSLDILQLLLLSLKSLELDCWRLLASQSLLQVLQAGHHLLQLVQELLIQGRAYAFFPVVELFLAMNVLDIFPIVLDISLGSAQDLFKLADLNKQANVDKVGEARQLPFSGVEARDPAPGSRR